MKDEPGGVRREAEREAQPMPRERLQTPEMQTLILEAEQRAATGRAGEGSTAEDLERMAREQPGADPATEAVRRRLAEDPDLARRLGEIREAIGSDDPPGPEVTPEGLPAFLRERG